jgi:hypothetical protein
MRAASTTAIAFAAMATLFAGGQVLAQTPTSSTGARPGNVIGTDSSLPTSDKASNILSTGSTGTIAPRLPAPPVGSDASAHDYLVAARTALAANKTGEAQEALERAESRALQGSVLATQISQPSDQPMVTMISQARTALAQGDKAGAMQAIDSALQGR